MNMEFSHVDEQGKARMVDVSRKPRVRRTAQAEGFVRMAPETATAVSQNTLAKGDVLGCARIAGIQAAKRTAELIPLCHNIEIEHVQVDLDVENEGVRIRSSCVCTDKTGIEMEALCAVSVAALTVYDMCKAIDKNMVVESVRLVSKIKEEIHD